MLGESQRSRFMPHWKALVTILPLVLIQFFSTGIIIPCGVLALSPDDPTTAPFHLIAVGGSSGMGKAAALEVLRRNGKVLLIARNMEKLVSTKKQLLDQFPSAHVEISSLDVTDERAMHEFTETTIFKDSEWDGLVVTVADKAVHGPVETLLTADVRAMVDSKFWGAYHCAKYMGPKLRSGGAVVFVAGVLNRRPGLNCAPLAIANGALEALTRSLALEWGPRLRVNCLSPGFCDTERFDHMDTERKAAMLANTAASLPLQKVGTPTDMGQAIYYLLTAPYVTGVVLDVDGGHLIRQYANPSNDPMRTNTS